MTINMLSYQYLSTTSSTLVNIYVISSEFIKYKGREYFELSIKYMIEIFEKYFSLSFIFI